MSFEDLPSLPPLLQPGADDYARRVSMASKEAMRSTCCALDLPYGDHYWQKVDIYMPPGGTGPWPVLCYLHGGAWANGCKEWMGFMAPGLVTTPLVFVSISYRLAPDARMPLIASDCADAVAWVYRNIESFGGSPQQMFIGGHSAGGHLAALLALRQDLLAPRGVPTPLFKACFPTSARFDLRPRLPASRSDQHLQARVLDSAESAWEWSPLRWAEGNTTPFLVTWGEEDFPDLVTQGTEFVQALRQQPGRVDQIVLASESHFTANEESGRPESRWRREATAWIQTYGNGSQA